MDHRRVQAQDTAAVELTLHDVIREIQDLRAQLLLRADDFPPTAPVLIITDADCDVVRVKREHAYLIPAGRRLPFATTAPIFCFE